MTEIICRWLNEDVQLSKKIEPATFAHDLSNGYFLGELLHKHGLQDDFDQFSPNKNSNAKLNNFMRLKPTISLLDIGFNTNIAREIMQENHSTTTQLLYQMYIALTNKEKRNLTGAAIETMRPAAPVRLEQFESKIYQKNLTAKTPRQTDLNLAMLRARYDKFKIEQDKIAFEHKFKEEEEQKNDFQNKRAYLLNKSKEYKQHQAELFARIKAAVVQIPKTPPKFKKEAILERKKLYDKNEGEKALKEIETFEKRFKTNNKNQFENDLSIVDLEETRGYDDSNEIQTQLDPVSLIKPNANDDYINKIRNRLQEDSHARKEREKRRRKVLVDQLKASEALEESKREESLITHLLRQSQFERRIAVELLHARHEKDVIRENRIAKEQEILDRREKEFQDALDKERELARLAKLEYAEQAKKDKECHDLIAAERAEAKYKKHYEICYEIVGQIVDFSCKVAEYRELTDDLIPPKFWRDWVNLFKAGKSLYPEKPKAHVKDIEKIFNADMAAIDEETVKLLDQCDFNEYKEMIGEWEPAEKLNNELVPIENKIVGYILTRLHEMCYPAPPGAPRPIFPKSPLKAILLGKPFAGKTSGLKLVNQSINIINPQELIEEAIEAYRKNPDLTPPEEKEKRPKEIPIQIPAKKSKEENENDSSSDTDIKGKKSKPSKDSLTTIAQSKDSKVSISATNLEESINTSQQAQVQANLQEKSLSDMSQYEIDLVKSDFLRRQLGSLALQSLNNGEPVQDEIIVHIIVEKIQTLSKEKGWIIDGFPTTHRQAKLLEKALTGYDEDHPIPEKPKQESILAPNPKPEPPRPKHKSAIDLVICLDLPNDIVLKRSAGRYLGTISNTLYHQQFKPPPDGSITGLNKVEVIKKVQDPSNDMEQIQHRISVFEENWRNIKEFYDNYSLIVNIFSGENDLKSLGEKIQNELDLFVKIREEKKQKEIEHKKMLELLAEQKKKEEDEIARKKKEEEQAAAEAEALRQLEEKKSLETIEAISPKGSAKNKKGKDSKADLRSKSPKKNKSPEKPVTPKDGKKNSGKGSKTKGPTPIPQLQEEPVLAKVDIPPELQPGSDQYVYLNEKIDQRMAKIMCDHWDVIENSYLDNSKFVFRKIRNEREQIIRYFFAIKNNFKDYLKRPDTKQLEIDAFVKEYNTIADDMRDDEEVKAELHQRVEDLNDKLWSICDNKKVESEKEREAIMNNGWLPDKIGFLTNHYITLMQTELDRFQDSSRMLKDYYKSMQNPMPDELPKEYLRLPLLDLKNPDELPSLTEALLESNASQSDQKSDSNSDGKRSPKSPRDKSPKSKSPVSKKTGSVAPPQAGGKKGKKTPDNLDENGKKRIPLIPRRPLSQDGKDAKKKKAKSSDDASPPPPEDPDERLIYDAYKNAYSYVTTIVNGEVAAHNTEETPVATTVEDPKNAKGGKKSKSPSNKKKPESAAPKSPKGNKKGAKATREGSVIQNTNISDLTEQDKARKAFLEDSKVPEAVEEDKNKAMKEKFKKEYLAALKKEESLFKTRMDLIKFIANKVILDIKQRADITYKEMDDKLGERFVREMNSIKALSNYIKNCIENKEKIKRELILEQDEFFIDDDIVVVRTPSPPPRPDPVENIAVENFTIDSLRKMFNQFKLVAPEGLVAVKTFIDVFNDIMLLNYSNEILPEQWSNLNQAQIESLAKMLASGSEFIDWRHWLLAASMPWVYPTQTQLLEMLKKYRQVDRNNSGFISKNVFLQTPLWFKIEKPPTPPEISKPHAFDRHSHLINFWFELFSTTMPTLPNLTGHSTINHTEERLDYKTMLLYMCAVSDPYDGFLRALSVSCEVPMPRIEPKVQMKSSTFNTPEYEQLKLLSATTESFPDDQIVSIDALYRVFHHGERQRGDTHRFAQTEDPEDFMSYQRIENIFHEINEEDKSTALYSKLIAHPVLCEMISICTKFRAPDFRTIFAFQLDENDQLLQDRRTPE